MIFDLVTLPPCRLTYFKRNCPRLWLLNQRGYLLLLFTYGCRRWAMLSSLTTLVRIFVDLYVLYLPNTYKSRSGDVKSNADDIYMRGWKSQIKTDSRMTLTSFAAFTIFRNLASFRIGKYVRNNVIDDPCTKPCGKLPELMFVSSTCGFQRRGVDCFLGRGHSFLGNILKLVQLSQIKHI